jgi:hypothetical protein
MVQPITIYNPRVLKCEIVAGQDETMDTTIPVTGMLQTDGLIGVCILSAALVMGQWRDINDFSVSAAAANLTVVAHAADYTGSFYLIIWQDLT